MYESRLQSINTMTFYLTSDKLLLLFFLLSIKHKLDINYKNMAICYQREKKISNRKRLTAVKIQVLRFCHTNCMFLVLYKL